jgi:hypothetical protein
MTMTGGGSWQQDKKYTHKKYAKKLVEEFNGQEPKGLLYGSRV